MIFHYHSSWPINFANGKDDIERFIKAQDSQRGGYNDALREIKSGKKTSHWIWYIFPQLSGLGSSSRSVYFGIADRNEAVAYLNHPVLGHRLREITTALLSHSDKTATQIFGGIDAMKVKSCMTLFDCISPNDVFGKALDQFFNGSRDDKSIV